MKVLSASNPQWANASHSAINLDVNFSGIGVVPFSASQLDTEAHGVDLFNRTIAGEFGVIAAPATKPIQEVKAEKLASLQQARDQAASADVTVQGKTFSADSKIADLFAKLADRTRRGKSSRLAAIYQVDGSPVASNAALLDAIGDAIADQTEAAWNKYGTLVGQMMAAATVEAVNNINW